jgi:hypothetical protein
MTSGTVYHGGSYAPGKEFKDSLVLYTSPNEALAKSYVDMSVDRFGPGAALQKFNVSFNPATEEYCLNLGERYGLDVSYTPASLFDVNLQDRGKLYNFIRILERQGYTGAIMGDIAYGEEIEGEAWIFFSPRCIKSIAEAKEPEKKAAKRNFELQVYETDNYDESPLPGEMLIFKETGKKYVPPEEPKEPEPEKSKKEESFTLEELDDWIMRSLH